MGFKGGKGVATSFGTP
ncbi:hypothetical protein [Thermus scotoductus]